MTRSCVSSQSLRSVERSFDPFVLGESKSLCLHCLAQILNAAYRIQHPKVVELPRHFGGRGQLWRKIVRLAKVKQQIRRGFSMGR
jgi:hypothetical protein